MYDGGHEWTDREIRRLENRIRQLYEEAADDIQEKLDRYLARFVVRDAELRVQLKNGKISKADYRDWLAGQVFQRKRWEATLEDLTESLARVNQLAMQLINETTPAAFAYNANWAAYTIERRLDAMGYDVRVIPRPGGAPLDVDAAAGNAAGVIRMGFGLYSEETVRRLLLEEPTLLPPSRVDIPKDKRWNMGNITRQITQGIVQGESVEQIAQRLRTVEEMNINSARNHAQTAMTAAQNAGREIVYEEAEAMGIELEREWIATLDSYTREAHRLLDGQRRPVDEAFEVTVKGRRFSILYPGDINADPRMVYGCRCTTAAADLRCPARYAKRRDDDPKRVPIKDMTYQEWLEYKSGGLW